MSKTNRKANELNMYKNLEKLRLLLPVNYTKMISEKFGVSEQTACNAMSGKSRRFDIIKYAIELAEENKSIVKKLAEVVNQ